jgi:hypothetical protein
VTKKDYIIVAKAVADARGEGADSEWPELTQVARNLADAFERENSGFDRQRFLFACGVQGTRS